MSVLLKPAAWAAHGLMLFGVALAVIAGLWQYGTWNAQRAAAERTLVDAEPVALSSVMGGDSAFPGASLGQPVTFTGTWAPTSTVYVSGQYHDGKRGYWAVTPVLIGKSAIPVVRGWTATTSTPKPTGQVSVTGWLEPSESAGEADTNPHDNVITTMRVPSMTQFAKVDLYSAYVVARSAQGSSTGLAGLAQLGPTHHPDVSGFTGLRNLLYALQWWIFGLLAIYIWYRWCLDQVHPPEDEAEDEADDSDEDGVEESGVTGPDPTPVAVQDPPVASSP